MDLVLFCLRNSLWRALGYDGQNCDGFGIDLKKRLDFEIWKSSYMISKSSIPSDLTDY